MKKTSLFLLISGMFFLSFIFTQSHWLSKGKRIDMGDSPGLFESENNRIASSGNHIYIVWEDERNGLPDDIYFNCSADSGATWQPLAIRIDVGDTPGSRNSYRPQISCYGSYVYIVWEDERNGLARDILLNYSNDYGDTWLAVPIRIDTGDAPGSFPSYNPEISSFGAYVCVVWSDERLGAASDIYFNYSVDYGATWLASAVPINTGDIGGGNRSLIPKIKCSASNAYVVWQEYRNGFSDIYFNSSSIWPGSDIRVDTGDTAGAFVSVSPQISISAANVYIVWADGRNGANKDILFNYSNNDGITWQPSAIRIDTGDTAGVFNSIKPQLSSSGSDVYIVWSDYRNGKADIYFNYSTDNGANWQTTPVRVDTGDVPGNDNSLDQQISSYGKNVYVTWEDWRGKGQENVYFNYSVDGGINWLNRPIRLNTGAVAGAFDVDDPRICCSSDSVYVAWDDNRNGDEDIYFNTTNTPPVADAGPDQEVALSEKVQLDGSNSADKDKDDLCFYWQIMSEPSGSTAVLNGINSVFPWFYPDKNGIYIIELEVEDIFAEKAADSVSINVAPSVYPPLNFSGEKLANHSYSQIECLNSLTWEANGLNSNIVNYKIFLIQDGIPSLLATVDYSTFKYLHRLVQKETIYEYALLAVNSKGEESDPVKITVK